MRKKGVVSLILVLVLLASSLVPAVAKELVYSDTEGHWAEEQILKLSAEGLLQGSKGQFRPNDNITRAEMAVIVDRLMDYQIVAENGFSDLDKTWYTDAILKNSNAGVIMGAEGAVRPEDKITRQEAVVMLSRALGIEEVDGSTTFTDDSQIGDWAKGYIKAFSDKDYIKGMPDGSFAPQSNITRASVVKILDNAIAKWITEAGTIKETVEGTVVINTPDVILKDTKITGDLIIAAGVGEGEVTLDDTRIDGQLIVYGGGENSIEIKGSTSFKGIVVKKEGKAVRVIAEAGVVVPEIIVTGETKVIIEGEADFKKIKVLGAETVEIREGTEVSEMEVEAEAVAIENDGKVNNIIVDEKGTGTVITGTGTVEEVVVGADNISIDTEGTTVVVEEDVEGTIVNGKETEGGTTATIPSTETDNGGSSGGGSSTPADRTAPVITIDSTKITSTVFGAVYEEPDWTTYFTVTDNVDGDIPVTLDMITEDVDINVVGTYTVEISVTDKAGNLATKSFGFTVSNEETAPVITIDSSKPTSATVGILSVEPDWTTYFTVTDNVDGGISVTLDMITEDVDINVVGTYTVEISVTDKAGNLATKSFGFTVENEKTAPVITIDNTKITSTVVGAVYEEPDWTTYFTVTDNIDGDIPVTIDMITEDVDINVAGTYTVEISVTDKAGNLATKSFEFTVENEKEAPVITLVDKKLMSGTVNVIAVEPDWTKYFTVTDNIDGNIPVTIDMITEDVDITASGAYTVKLTVNDAAGNEATETINFKMRTTYMDGDGMSEDTAFQVETIEDLSLIGKGEAAGDGNSYALDSYYVLTRDLDFTSDASYENPGIADLFDRDMDGDTSEILKDALSSSSAGYGFTPIAKDTGTYITNPFTGTIDGKNHNISNLYINTPMNYSVGFIGGGENCTIKNIGFTNAVVTGRSAVGIVAGELTSSTISNSYADGNVEVKAGQTGGLVGRSEETTVENCNTSGLVTGIGDGASFENSSLGGLIGSASEGKIVNSHSTMKVTGLDDIGGLVGRALRQSIEGSYAKGNVSGNDSVGGLIGSTSSATVENSHAVGSVSGNDDVGGLIGKLDGGLTRYSYATGNVQGNRAVGGLVGDVENNSQGEILNCYATGNVSGKMNLGGLIGHWHQPPMYQGTMGYCYASGNVLGDTSYDGTDGVGGIVGDLSGGITLSNTIAFNDILVGNGTANKRVIGNAGGFAKLETNYAKADMTINSVQGTSGALDDINGADLSATQFQMESFFTTAGNWTSEAWDFTHIWEFKEGAVRPTLREGAGSTLPEPDTTAPVISFTGKSVLFHLGVDTVEPDWTTYFNVEDNVDGNIAVTQGMITENVDLTQAGNYTVTVSVTDSAGNNKTYDLGIIVMGDSVPPFITIDNTKITSTVAGAVYEEPDWTTYFTVTDNVDGVMPVTSNMITENVDINVAGTYTVKIDVTDNAGNSATKSFEFTVANDETAPVITIDSSKSTSATVGILSVEPDWRTYFTVTDNVDGAIPVTLGMITEDVDITASGAYTITIKVSDAAGNEATETINFTMNN